MKAHSTINWVLALVMFTSITAAKATSGPITLNVRNIDASNAASVTPYLRAIKKRIAYYWKPNASNEMLSTKIYLGLNLDGSIMRCEVERHSGDDRFDQSCIESIQEASPFPAGPNCGVSVILTEVTFVSPTVGAPGSNNPNPGGLGIGPGAEDRSPYPPNGYPQVPPGSNLEPPTLTPANNASSSKMQALKGFRLLSAYQLKFIPSDQMAVYREKLAIWDTLTFQEKLNLR